MMSARGKADFTGEGAFHDPPRQPRTGYSHVTTNISPDPLAVEDHVPLSSHQTGDQTNEYNWRLSAVSLFIRASPDAVERREVCRS